LINKFDFKMRRTYNPYFIIFGFIISGASTYLFRDANGNNLFQLNTTTSRPINFFIPWIADKGLQILTNSSTCEITLFHSQGGA